ncbi:MAG: START domain-containing protein [Sediminibacterium sp.]
MVLRLPTMFKQLGFLVFLLFIYLACPAQGEWVLKSDKDDIKTYNRSVVDSKLNAVKIETVFTASLSQFVSVLQDVGSYDKWVYGSRSTRLLKEVSPSELVYYSEVDFPWPTTDRDFVSHVIISHDAQTHTVHVNAKNVQGWVPVKSKIVRIERSSGDWTITSLANGRIKVEYILQVDPGGDLPAWIINSFSSKGVVETFKNLREWIKKPGYANARPSFITD